MSQFTEGVFQVAMSCLRGGPNTILHDRCHNLTSRQIKKLIADKSNNITMDDNSTSIRYLPDDYEPTHTDVLCGRGRKCYFHPGNVRFRDIVQDHLVKYSAASSKMEKGHIISLVYEEICEQSDMGGFIKKDENGRWYDVGEFLAREKVSQAFRDALHDKYKSSTTSKRKRRELMAMSSELHSQRSLCSYTSVSTEPSLENLERAAIENLSDEQERLSSRLLDLLDRDLEGVFSSRAQQHSFQRDYGDLSFRGGDDTPTTVYQQESLSSQSCHAPRFDRMGLLHRGQSCPTGLGWHTKQPRSLHDSIGVVSLEDEDDYEPLDHNTVCEIDTFAMDMRALEELR